MKPEIIKFCMERGILLDKEAGEMLSELSEEAARKIIEKISTSKEKIITKSFFSKNFESFKESGDFFEKLKINLGVSVEIFREIAKKQEESPVKPENAGIKQRGNVKVLYSSSNPTRKLLVDDFVKYFRNRFSAIKGMLQQRSELEGLVSINKLGNNNQRQGVSVIGLVFSKRITKNKNILLELEDLTGKISVLVNQNKPELYEKARDVVVDSVIGVKGAGNREFIFANDLFYPEAILPERTTYSQDESVAFTSDAHVGSKMFLEKNFLRFINWLNGNLGDEKQRKEALKIKYLFLTGDNVDGVGVYPGQENLLKIVDIKKQYEKLAEHLSMIRKDVTIIICPGQHDAVRVAEPQPMIDKEFGYALHELDNVLLVSNPAFVEITPDGKDGVKILMYHGASMSLVINEVESLRAGKAHDSPAKVVRYLLKTRHLAPIHSSVTYIPNEKDDELVIREVPDVITTADLHRPEVDVSNNVLIVCSSCWQSITPFEEKVGNHPDPCKVPILNLKTRQIKIMDFSEMEEEETCEEKEGGIVCGAEK